MLSRTMVRKSAKKPSDKSESPVKKIVVGVIIALVAGGSSPWWWTVISPKPVVKIIAPECSPEVLKSHLFRAAASDKAAVIRSTARTLQEKFSLQEFECVSGLATVLLEQDPNNGYGLYFKGETWRVQATQDPKHSKLCRSQMRDHFFKYLNYERSLSSNERDGGDDKACYEREKGYCGGRTAYINHLMAIDYYRQFEDSKDDGIKIKLLEGAAKFLKIDMQFGGFDQIIPSAVLRDKIEQELQKLGAAYPADV